MLNSNTTPGQFSLIVPISFCLDTSRRSQIKRNSYNFAHLWQQHQTYVTNHRKTPNVGLLDRLCYIFSGYGNLFPIHYNYYSNIRRHKNENIKFLLFCQKHNMHVLHKEIRQPALAEHIKRQRHVGTLKGKFPAKNRG